MSQFVSTYTALQGTTHIHAPINWTMSPTSGDTPVLDKAVTSVTATLNLIAHHTCDVQIQIGDYVQAFHMASFGTGGAGVVYNFTVPTALLGQVSKWISTPVSLTVLRSSWPADEVRFRYLTFTMAVNFSTSSGSLSGLNKQLVFGKQPPAVSAASQTYTMRIDAVDGSSGAVDISFSGQLRLQLITLATGAAVPLNQWLSGSSSTGTEYLFSMAAGSTVITLDFTILTGNSTCYFVVAPMASGVITSGTSGQTRRAGSSLVWSTEPSLANTVGQLLGTSPVLTSYTSGAVDTSDSLSLVTLTVNKADGSSPANENSVIGTLTGTLAAGTVTFGDITITQPGGYTLTATAPGYAETTTRVFYGVGFSIDENVPAMRQDIGYDGTAWRLTTGLSPSFASPTAAQLTIINGDLSSAQGVTTDGLRIVPPYITVVKKLVLKYSLSTLAGGPLVKIYTSTDSTDPTTGTWTLQETITPDQTLEIVEYKPETAIWCRGIWATLDANGGAATCSWRSFQVMGNYIQPAVDFIDVTTGNLIADEEYLSIPKPITRLSGGTVVTRNVLLRNNTGSPITVLPTVTPARSDGDVLGDEFHCLLLDSAGVEIGAAITLPANGNTFLTLQYTITAAENDNTGKHYIRFDLATAPAVISVSRVLIMDTNSAAGTMYKKTTTGGTDVSIGTGGYTGLDVAMDFDGGVGLGLIGLPASQFLQVTGIYATTHSNAYANTTSASSLAMRYTGVGTAGTKTRLGYSAGVLAITDSGSTTVWYGGNLYTSTATSQTLAGAFSTLSIAAQTTGQKIIIGGEYGYFYVANGTSGAVKVYRYTTAGVLSGTLDISAWLGARTLSAMWYDRVGHRLYLSTTVSGGSRNVAWYGTRSMTLISSTTNADQITEECTGGIVNGTAYYLLFGGRYAWSYTTRFSGGSLLVDFNLAGGTGTSALHLFNQ